MYAIQLDWSLGDLNDSLLRAAKQLAAKRQQTLKRILETALQQFLEANADPRPVFRRKQTYGGRGLQPGVTEGDWSALRQHIYQERG